MNEVWQVGDFKITRVVEMEVTGGTRFILPDATRDACLPIEWLQPHFMDAAGNLIMSIHALIIDTGSHRLVVDTCIGNDKQRDIPAWSNLQTSFLEDFEKTGYPLSSIDYVLCTHLHVDHVGWNTRLVNDEWIPTFPNAEYLIAENEWQYWVREDGARRLDQIYQDSVRPIESLVRTIDVEKAPSIVEGIRLKPTPGHTPGHVSVEIESRGECAIITGDFVHHPCQMTQVDWCSSADTDQREALNTRLTTFAELVDTDTLVIGTHFATPTAGHVRRHTNGNYWLQT